MVPSLSFRVESLHWCGLSARAWLPCHTSSCLKARGRESQGDSKKERERERKRGERRGRGTGEWARLCVVVLCMVCSTLSHCCPQSLKHGTSLERNSNAVRSLVSKMISSSASEHEHESCGTDGNRLTSSLKPAIGLLMHFILPFMFPDGAMSAPKQRRRDTSASSIQWLPRIFQHV